MAKIQSVEPNIADLANGWLKSYKRDYKLEQESLNTEIDQALNDYYSKNGGVGGNRPDAKLLLQDKNLVNYPILIEYKGYKDKLVKLDADGKVANKTAKNQPDFRNINSYAVNGAVHYANALLHYTSYTDIIAIGMTGYKNDAGKLEYEIGVYYVSKSNFGVGQKVDDFTDLSFLKMLDYEKIGRSMREGEGGVFTPHGYVMQESELRQAPPNLGRPPRKPPYMIYFLCVSDVRAVKLYLPAKQAELDAVLNCLEVDSWQEVRLEECDAAMPEMWFFTDMACDSMEQVNRFAQCLTELDMNRELIKFKAVAGHLNIRSLDDALALAEHLSEYALEPGIHSLEELAREELSVIVSDPDRDLLTRHLNMEAYGADLLWRDQGLFSDYGYICRPDGQPLQVPRQGVDMTMQ